MKSKRGLTAAIVSLLAFPLTVGVAQLGGSDEVTIHWAFAVGFGLFASSLFDFKVPRWISGVSSLALVALAVIFFLQGLHGLAPSETLYRIAYDTMGQGVESASADLFLLWCLAALRFDSRDRTRVVGLVVVPLALLVEVYRHAVRFMGDQPQAITLLVFLLPIVWLLLESAQPRLQST